MKQHWKNGQTKLFPLHTVQIDYLVEYLSSLRNYTLKQDSLTPFYENLMQTRNKKFNDPLKSESFQNSTN